MWLHPIPAFECMNICYLLSVRRLSFLLNIVIKLNFSATNPTALLCRISLAQQTKADCKYARVQTHTRNSRLPGQLTSLSFELENCSHKISWTPFSCVCSFTVFCFFFFLLPFDVCSPIHSPVHLLSRSEGKSCVNLFFFFQDSMVLSATTIWRM